MAQISYGSITIVDVTDVGQFSVYPRATSPKTQIYNPDASSYTPNWDTANGGTAVTISPVAYYAGRNVTSSASYTWKRKIGGTESNLITGESVSSGVLTINKNILADISGGLITYVCHATYTVDDIQLEAIGEIDFSLIRQGSAAKVAKITGESIFKVNTNNQFVPANPSITLTATVNNTSISAWKYYESDTTVANRDADGYVVYPNSGTGTTLTVRPTDTPFTNSDTVKIKLVTSDTNTYDIFNISILRDGAPGETVVSAVLSNEDQMIPVDQYGNESYSGTTTELTIFEGNTDVTTGNGWSIIKSYIGGITDSATEDYRANVTAMTNDTGTVTFTCTKSGYNTFAKSFSLVKISAGADGSDAVVYSLEPDAIVVNESYTYDSSGTLTTTTRTPGTVTFRAYKTIGNEKTAYSGRIQFYINGSSSISNVQNTDVSSRSYNFSSNSSTTRLRAVLYAAGANTTELDSQSVIVVNDGSKGIQGEQGIQGVSAISLITTNEADVIACDSDGHPFQTFSIVVPFEGYQGITKKITNCTNAPTLSKTTWGTASDITPTIVNATASAAGSITYQIPTTATVPESGQITFTFTVKAADGDVTGIQKIYTWTRSKAAINGENSVILQVLTPDGTIYDNGSGTLTITGELYDGPNVASGVTYKYYKYSNGNYNTEITSTTNTDSIYKSGTSLKVKGTAVDGYASFKITATYSGTTYTQYVSLIDKTDPLQVSVHSTIGTQIKNAQGMGCLYVRVTRDGTEIDPVPANITTSETNPTSPNNGDYFIKLTKPTGTGTFQNTAAYTGSAQLMKYNGSTWVAQTPSCTYTWTYRDKDNNPLGTSDKKPATSGQYIYIDGDLISNKITADVQVTLN